MIILWNFLDKNTNSFQIGENPILLLTQGLGSNKFINLKSTAKKMIFGIFIFEFVVDWQSGL